MASKKYILILGFICMITSAVYSQQGDAAYDWRDSSKISTKLMPQQSEFLNNQYPYPARPRDQWELGISGGLSGVSGSSTFQGLAGGSPVSGGSSRSTIIKTLSRTAFITLGISVSFDQLISDELANEFSLEKHNPSVPASAKIVWPGKNSPASRACARGFCRRRCIQRFRGRAP